ncbi:ThiF family adenylyltransferase [Methylomicrobium sp. RS1]|uniref:ThiF family adenylyltransferase n=1 Tax=Candidatus Methylomicrobium oryzae TaxID=2802053 RepID=UPI001922640B|nr:ThiF family adenylyltransferase [Methylomicrobium sp. RS1]MBL1264945.1 ThiF family adenylyltransferase [Methylomicrobium sp. RS1]
MSKFNYEEAFSRNIGWVTEKEQKILRGKKVAIAGVGGVGGVHLLTLTRLGVGRYSLADPDTFELANMNRQVGAMMSTMGLAKVDVLANIALDINPELQIKKFRDGVNQENVDAFLEGADIFIDGLDFYVLDVRRKIFARCAELNIPAITAAPFGMGSGYLIFMPGKMTFEEYFCMEGLGIIDQQINFAVGLVPKGLHKSYLIDPARFDFANHKAPSTFMGCEFCAAVAGVEALKILLSRGKTYAVPYYHQFDCYTGRWKRGWLPGGNRNPLQWIKKISLRRQLIKSQ